MAHDTRTPPGAGAFRELVIMMGSYRSLLRSAATVAGLVALAWSPAGAQAAGVLRGRVTAESGQPAAGVTVEVLGGWRAITGETGGYRIERVPAGSQVVRAFGVGWKAIRRTVDVAAGRETELNLVLEADALRLEDVVVSVSREAQTRSEATASVGVVGAEDLALARPHHPADVVSRIAGAWVANLSGEGHMTAIRQPITTKPVYAYLEDGVPIRSTGFFNHNALYEINLPQSDRVEIIKGPGSALYGSDAIGGVVNAFTRAPTAGSSGELFVEGGRFGYARALATASTTTGTDGFRADLNLTRSDSYRDRAPYSRQSGTLRWDRRTGATTLKSVLAVSHIDQPGDGGGDLPESDYLADPSLNYTPVAFRRVTAIRVSSTLERSAGLSHLTATVFGRYNALDLLPSWQLSFDPQVWESRNRSLGALARYRRTVLPLRANLSVGLDLEASPGSRMEQQLVVQRNGSFFQSYTLGDIQYDYDVTFWQASPYLQFETTPWDALRIDLGLRYDYVGFNYDNGLSELQTGSHRRPASTNVSYRRLNPKIGANLTLAPGVNVFASYRSAFRSPSESQLFRQGSAVSTIDLEPVKADNYEAGVRLAPGRRFGMEATVYQLDIKDDILGFFNPANGLRTSTNAGATRHKGVELGLMARPHDAVRIDGSWAVTRQRYRDWRPNPTADYSGNEIEIAPRNMGRVGLTLTPAALGPGALTAEWVHLGSYWMDPQNTEKYEGHDLFNVAATVPIAAELEVVARLQNLADTRYAETSSFSTLQGRRFRPGPPRTFYVGAQYRFGSAGAGR